MSSRCVSLTGVKAQYYSDPGMTTCDEPGPLLLTEVCREPGTVPGDPTDLVVSRHALMNLYLH